MLLEASGAVGSFGFFWGYWSFGAMLVIDRVGSHVSFGGFVSISKLEELRCCWKLRARLEAIGAFALCW